MKLDKSVLSKSKKGNHNLPDTKRKTISARKSMEEAWYLICSAYNLDVTKDHRLDKSILIKKKRTIDQ